MTNTTWTATITEEGRPAIARQVTGASRLEALQNAVIAYAHEVGDERALAGTTDYQVRQ